MTKYKYHYEYLLGRLQVSTGWLKAENITEAKVKALAMLEQLEIDNPKQRKLLWVEPA